MRIAVFLFCFFATIALAARPAQVEFGLLLGYEPYINAAMLAVEDINNGFYANLLPGTTLVVSLQEDTYDTTTVANALSFLNYCNTSTRVVAVIGGEYSTQSIQLQALFTPFQIPQISTESTSPELSDKSKYPFFYRTVPPDTLSAIAIARFITSQAWQRVGVITSQDSYGQGGLSAFLSVADSYQLRVLTSVTTDGSTEDVRSKVKLLKAAKAKIIICLAQDLVAAEIIHEAKEIGLIGSNYVWVLSEALYNYVLYNDDAFYQEAFGMLHGGFVVNIGAKTTQYTDHFYSRWAAKGYSDSDIDIYALSAYDAVIALGAALENAYTANIDPTNGTAFRTAFATVNREGITGRVGFSENGNPIETHYQLVNIVSPNRTAPENYETVDIGLIEINSTSVGLNTTTSSIALNQSLITWGTKSNSRPSDQFPRKGLRAYQWGLIAMGIALAILLAVVVVFLLMREKFHVIFIPKTLENDEWGSA